MASHDLNVLLEFIKPDAKGEITNSSKYSAQIYSLEALSSMCANDGSHAKEMKDCGGIDLVLNLLYNSGGCPDIQQSCMFMLACAAESNVHVQQFVTSDKIFKLLHTFVMKKEKGDVLQIVATYFLLALVSRNKQGQTKVLSSGCLDTLMHQFVSYHKDLETSKVGLEELKHLKIIIKTMSYSVNIPQNELNQNVCCKILPWVISAIHLKHSYDVTQHCCKFLSVIVENNRKCQKVAFETQALEVLILLLKYLLEKVTTECVGECVNALSCLLQGEAADKESKRKFTTLGGIYLIVDLLSLEVNEKWMVVHVSEALNLLTLCMQFEEGSHCNKHASLVADAVVDVLNRSYNNDLNQQAIKLLTRIYDSGIKSMGSNTEISMDKLLSKDPICLNIRNSSKVGLKRSCGVLESPSDAVRVHLKPQASIGGARMGSGCLPTHYGAPIRREVRKSHPRHRKKAAKQHYLTNPRHNMSIDHSYDVVSICSGIIDDEVAGCFSRY